MEPELTSLETTVYQIVLSCGLNGVSVEEIQKRLKTQGIDKTTQDVRKTLQSLKQDGKVE